MKGLITEVAEVGMRVEVASYPLGRTALEILSGIRSSSVVR